MAITSGLFAEPESDRVAHSSASYLIASDPFFEAWANSVTGFLVDAGSSFPQASEKWPMSSDPAHSAFSLAYQTPMPFPGYIQQNPLMMKNFMGFLKATQKIEANDLRHLTNSFDWASLGSATVIDVSSAPLNVSTPKFQDTC